MICINIYPVSLSSCISRFSRKASVTLRVHETGIIDSVLFVRAPTGFLHLWPWRSLNAWFSVHAFAGCSSICQSHLCIPSTLPATLRWTHTFLTDRLASCVIRADAPHWGAHSSPQSEPSLGRTTSPSAGDQPGEGGRSYPNTPICTYKHIYEDPDG